MYRLQRIHSGGAYTRVPENKKNYIFCSPFLIFSVSLSLISYLYLSLSLCKCLQCGVQGSKRIEVVPCQVTISGSRYRVTSYTWPCAFWHLVKRDLSSVRYCRVAYTIVTFYKVPEKHDHVYLVGSRCTLAKRILRRYTYTVSDKNIFMYFTELLYTNYVVNIYKIWLKSALRTTHCVREN